MKPRTQEQLAAISASLSDPRGVALSIVTLAMVTGGARDTVPMRQAVSAAAEVVDDLFDRLERLSEPVPSS
jgi:hypothetical protein